MPRLTIALEDRDHLALRLLALRDGKRLNEVVDEAVKHYLESAGAYTLRISDSETNP
jgi:predicted HicB family RNase H-like nuclease